MKEVFLGFCLAVLCTSSMQAEHQRVKQIKATLQLGAGALGIYYGAKLIKQNFLVFALRSLVAVSYEWTRLDVEEAKKLGQSIDHLPYISKEKQEQNLNACTDAAIPTLGGAALVVGGTYLLYRSFRNFTPTEKTKENTHN